MSAIAQYYHKEARLRIDLNMYERLAGGGIDRPSAEEQEAAAGTSIDEDATIEVVGFGLEIDPERHLVTVGEYNPPPFANDADEVKYVRAALVIHKTRLEHEDGEDFRFPVKDDFEHTLDYSTLVFIKALLSQYIDASAQSKGQISDELAKVLYRAQQFSKTIIDRRDKIVELKRLIEAKEGAVINGDAMEIDSDGNGAEDDNTNGGEENGATAEETDEKQLSELRDELDRVIESTIAENPYPTPDIDTKTRVLAFFATIMVAMFVRIIL